MSEKTVQLNEEVIKSQIKELVRGSVEETLTELLANARRGDIACQKNDVLTHRRLFLAGQERFSPP